MKRRVERLTNPSLNTAAIKNNGKDAQNAIEPLPLNEEREMKQVNALYSLLENRYASDYPLPARMRYPASRETHYDDFLKELEAAPTRSKFDSFLARLKGRFRLTR